MSLNKESAFLVKAYAEPIVIKINGRASYLNCAPVSDFFARMIENGKKSFVIDFQECQTMDSTFLGIIAGLALDLRKMQPPGSVSLCRLSKRNLELVRNLGLHRIINVGSEEFPMVFGNPDEKLNPVKRKEIDNAKMILKAHENLVEIEDTNKSKFQDVIDFLKNQVKPE